MMIMNVIKLTKSIMKLMAILLKTHIIFAINVLAVVKNSPWSILMIQSIAPNVAAGSK